MSELHPAIARAVSRVDISPHLADEYQTVFALCADWFAPSNAKDDQYDRAAVLHHVGLLDCRRTARWKSGSFCGYMTEFKQAAGLAHGPATPSDGGDR